MKKMVKIAVLLATLLLLTGVAFSADECYEVTCTNLDNGEKLIHHVVIYPDYSENEGRFDGFCGEAGNMVTFFDAMKLQALAFSAENNPLAYLKFHGDDFHVVTGIVYCNDIRWDIRGHVVDNELCTHSMTMEPGP